MPAPTVPPRPPRCSTSPASVRGRPSYIAMRGLGDPDVFLPTDLGVRNALERMDLPTSANDVAELAERWRPWRSYAVMHLWRSL